MVGKGSCPCQSRMFLMTKVRELTMNTIQFHMSLLVSKLPDSEKEEVEKRPCIGLCYYLKLQGIVFDKYKAKMKSREDRKPCIGMCFREKKRKSRARKQKKTDEKKKNDLDLM